MKVNCSAIIAKCIQVAKMPEIGVSRTKSMRPIDQNLNLDLEADFIFSFPKFGIKM